jgi:hypothetical protein
MLARNISKAAEQQVSPASSRSDVRVFLVSWGQRYDHILWRFGGDLRQKFGGDLRQKFGGDLRQKFGGNFLE